MTKFAYVILHIDDWSNDFLSEVERFCTSATKLHTNLINENINNGIKFLVCYTCDVSVLSRITCYYDLVSDLSYVPKYCGAYNAEWVYFTSFL